LREAAVTRIRAFVSAQPGWHDLGVIQSPITGGDGNVEFLIAAEHQG
jgi:23S rRNA (cytidine1920-2'-O)/16S rRNA (cytidine1409-2'-O)-methyltransferase